MKFRNDNKMDDELDMEECLLDYNTLCKGNIINNSETPDILNCIFILIL